MDIKTDRKIGNRQKYRHVIDINTDLNEIQIDGRTDLNIREIYGRTDR